jgi:phosphoserine phosphatase RsbU/P
LRQAILMAAVMALGGAAPFAAQSGTSRPVPFAGSHRSAPGRPRAAAKGASEDAPAVFDATALGSPIRLDKDWRVGISDDPSAAAPDFDDSGWAVRGAQSSMPEVSSDHEPDSSGVHVEVGPPDRESRSEGTRRLRYAWFRLHLRLAPNHGPLALLVELPVTQNMAIGEGAAGPGVDVFVNGRQTMPEGPHGDTPQHYQAISRLYDLNLAAGQTELTLALRTLFVPFGRGSYTTFFAGRGLSLGHHDDLEGELRLWQDRSLFERLPRLVYSALLVVLAMFLFALYFSQRGHSEYLWLALHELAAAPIGFVELAGSSARLDSLWYAALILELLLISAYLFFEFLVSFLALPRKWYIRWLRYTAPILALVGPSLLMVGRIRSIGLVLAIVVPGVLVWMGVWAIFIFVTLIAAAVRRNFEAGLLLIPLVLELIGIVEPLITSARSDATGPSYHSPLTVMAGPIPIHFASIADFTGILVIVLIIFFRFLRIHRDQERVSSELAAARSVQELMIPQEKLSIPGFEVDSIYHPANEVGGDFFHVEKVSNDGMLVVIGDVAGKGLKAAMNVSMLMGALRRTADKNPGKILESLNRVLVGTESFTTCQAAWFGANGELVLANAGHLPPYLNSQEVTLKGGLPLGVLPDATYEESRLYLHPGDRILLLSDGVVEARKSSGELFGFDRVHNLSNQSAFYLAEAAKAFGQEDDITVLTVRRMTQIAA